MNKIKIEIELFTYNELNEKAKEKAFNEHYEFLCITAEEHKTEESIYEGVEESININDYLFFNDGELANTTHFCGEHPKAGKTEFTFKDKIYEISK
jgi:hypothetical protein